MSTQAGITDDQILVMLQNVTQLQQQLDASKAASDKKWVTNCSYAISQQRVINLQTANIDGLKELLNHLLHAKANQKQIASILGVLEEDSYNGYKFDQWVSDCKIRMAKLNLYEQAVKLQKMDSKLNELISPEVRRQLELQEVQNSLQALMNPSS